MLPRAPKVPRWGETLKLRKFGEPIDLKILVVIVTELENIALLGPPDRKRSINKWEILVEKLLTSQIRYYQS